MTKCAKAMSAPAFRDGVTRVINTETGIELCRKNHGEINAASAK
jgi:hypothetical protein